MEHNEGFEFTYSAPEQEEIRRIREKYLPREVRESKMDQLRRLDENVTKKGTWVAIFLGTISALVLGLGMSLCLVWYQMLPGIVIGLVGMIGVAAAYPVYAWITERERKRIAPEILRLSEELLQ